jgi:hypothetical protein
VARRKFEQHNNHIRSWKVGDEIPIFARFIIGASMEIHGHSKLMTVKLSDEASNIYHGDFLMG